MFLYHCRTVGWHFVFFCCSVSQGYRVFSSGKKIVCVIRAQSRYCPRNSSLSCVNGIADIFKGDGNMFRKKWHETLFTIVTSGLMIFIMGVYNVAINTDGLTYRTVGYALHAFPLEWLIGFIFAYFIASRTSKYFAFQVVRPQDRPILIILCIQTFTVCTMVPLMSMLGTVESSGVTLELPVIWIQTIFLNFIMALPLQIFVVGPFCRFLFRHTMRTAATEHKN